MPGETSFLPDLESTLIRKKAKLSEMQKRQIIEEEGTAANMKKLDLTGTHYEDELDDEIMLFLDF